MMLIDLIIEVQYFGDMDMRRKFIIIFGEM